MPRYFWSAGAAIAAALAASAAFAQSDVVVTYQPAEGTLTRSVAVETRDLQLSTAEGRAALDRRITLAARRACGYEGIYGLRQPADFKRCFSKARSDALD